MSQIEILKRAMIVLLLAGAAAAVLAPRDVPVATTPALAAIDHGVVQARSAARPVASGKSRLRALPAETPATTVALVGLRAKA